MRGKHHVISNQLNHSVSNNLFSSLRRKNLNEKDLHKAGRGGLIYRKPHKFGKTYVGDYIFLIIPLLIAGILLFLYLTPEKEQEKKYSDEPKKWITTKGSIKSIDIESATAGAGSIDFVGEQYNDKNISTAFRYSGFYDGHFFEDSYANEDGRVLMRINNNMKPYDGIIDGFIIEKIKDGKPMVYVFVDDDWRKNLGVTYIWYGKSFENKKVFVYNEISNGIYMDSFEDDSSRFIDDYSIHLGGVIVGDVSEKKVSDGDTDITLIKFV